MNVRDRPLLNVYGAAERLSVSEKTVPRLVARGGLPGLKVGSSLRIDAGELAQRYTYEVQLEELCGGARKSRARPAVTIVARWGNGWR